MSSIGERIRYIRKKKGISQVELAREIGCAPNTIAGWELNPNRNPSKSLLGKISLFFNISIEQLMGLENKASISKIAVISNYQIHSNFIDIEALRVADDSLEPIAKAGDLIYFKKFQPDNGNLVLLYFSKTNTHVLKNWYRDKYKVILTEISPYSKILPQSFRIYKEDSKANWYQIEKSCKDAVIEVRGVASEIRRKLLPFC